MSTTPNVHQGLTGANVLVAIIIDNMFSWKLCFYAIWWGSIALENNIQGDLVSRGLREGKLQAVTDTDCLDTLSGLSGLYGLSGLSGYILKT